MGKPQVQGLLTESPWQRRRSHCRCPRAPLQPRASGWHAARTRRTLSLTAARGPKHAEGYRSEPLGQLQHGHVRGGSTGEGPPAPSALPKGERRASRHPNRSRVLSLAAQPGARWHPSPGAGAGTRGADTPRVLCSTGSAEAKGKQRASSRRAMSTEPEPCTAPRWARGGGSTQPCSAARWVMGAGVGWGGTGGPG